MFMCKHREDVFCVDCGFNKRRAQNPNGCLIKFVLHVMNGHLTLCLLSPFLLQTVQICCYLLFVGNCIITIWTRGQFLVKLALVSTLNLHSTTPASLEILEHRGMTALSLEFLSSPEVDFFF